MQIQILNVTVQTVPTAKGSYQLADVAFKNLTYNKVEGKKVMSFGATKDTFTTLSQAQAGQVYNITVFKNDKGYNDWTSANLDDGSTPAASGGMPVKSAAPNAAARTSTYETPEERAQRQILIVRQSSLSSAIATLTVGAKGVKPNEVIDLAKQYENYVFGKQDAGASGFEDIPDFDIPAVA